MYIRVLFMDFDVVLIVIVDVSKLMDDLDLSLFISRRQLLRNDKQFLATIAVEKFPFRQPQG